MTQILDSIAGSISDQVISGNPAEIYKMAFDKYRSLTGYKEFKSEILQAFRELGNSIVVIQLLEEHIVTLL